MESADTPSSFVKILFTGFLPSIGCPIVACACVAGICLPNRCLVMGIHVKIWWSILKRMHRLINMRYSCSTGGICDTTHYSFSDACLINMTALGFKSKKTKLNSVALVSKLVEWSAQRIPTVVSLYFLDPEPLLFHLSSSSIILTRMSGPRSRPTTSQKIW
jgi:hypothetical protein